MFKAQFFRAVGLTEKDIGPPVALRATTLAQAEREALSWPKPEGSNFVKVLHQGQIVSKPGRKR